MDYILVKKDSSLPYLAEIGGTRTTSAIRERAVAFDTKEEAQSVLDKFIWPEGWIVEERDDKAKCSRRDE